MKVTICLSTEDTSQLFSSSLLWQFEVFTCIMVRTTLLLFLAYQRLCNQSPYIGLFGVLVRLYTVGFTPKNTSGRNTSEGQIANELNTTGLYSLTRNPLYVGNFFMWMGLVFYIGVIWFFLLFICVFWIYYERIIFAEETFLREKFKESYIQWANKTAVFIPKKFRYVHPQKSFRWKKIVIKEKSTILMFFLVFFILQQFSAFFEFNTTQIELSQITYGFLASIALYALIKSLQVLGKLSTE